MSETAAKRTWFARKSFPMAPNQKPRYHALERLDGTVHIAVCGYTCNFILEEPYRRDSPVKAKNRTCQQCVKKLEKQGETP
jgi:hypothetical protein